MAAPHLSLTLLGWHSPGLITLLLVFGLPLGWRNAGPPEKAGILILGSIALLDLAAWAVMGGALLAHTLIDSLALAWLVPLALKANRHYPALLAAGFLVAASTQWLALTGLATLPRATALIVESGHFVAALAFLLGWLRHRKGPPGTDQRPPWRDQLQRK